MFIILSSDSTVISGSRFNELHTTSIYVFCFICIWLCFFVHKIVEVLHWKFINFSLLIVFNDKQFNEYFSYSSIFLFFIFDFQLREKWVWFEKYIIHDFILKNWYSRNQSNSTLSNSFLVSRFNDVQPNIELLKAKI